MGANISLIWILLLLYIHSLKLPRFALKPLFPPLSRYRLFPNRRGGVSGFGVPPSRRPAAQEQAGGGGGGRHNWGQGFRLGDN